MATKREDYFGGDHKSPTPRSYSTMSKSSSILDGADERTSLLSSSPPSRGQVLDISVRRTSGIWKSHSSVIFILMVVVLLVGCCDQLNDSPQSRIFESIICYRYYEKHDPSRIQIGREAVGPGALGGVAEMYCKVNPVQDQLAMLRGYQQLFDGIPALLLAIPFGWAADRWGRWPIMMLGFISFIFKIGWMQVVSWFWQAFDIRMTWLSSLPLMMSGGSGVLSAMFFVVLADVTTEAERAGVFLRAGAANILGNLFMPPLSAALMAYNPWIPSFGGTLMLVLAGSLYATLPETLNYRDSSDSHPPSPSTESAPLLPDVTPATKPISFNYGTRWTAGVLNATSFFFNDWRVPALTLSFIGNMLFATTGQLLVQYISKRYELTFSKATLLMTVYNGVKVLLLFIILPYASTTIMQTFHLSAQKKDLYLSRVSFILIFVGWVFIGLSPNVFAMAISLAIASLGKGAWLMVRSFLTSLVPAHHIARVYSVISIVDTLGAMFGGALLAALYKHGLALGGAGIGLPFLFLGLLAAAFAALLFMVKLRPGEDVVHEERHEEEEL